MSTQNQATASQQAAPQHHDELILVVPRAKLFPKTAWQGLQAVDEAKYTKLIQQEKEFHPRSKMEQDPAYKQIIPYLIFTHDNKLFVMQRQAKISEARLQNKFSLGIGGHINESDLTDSNIMNWARREFDEEVTYQGSYDIHTLGILNDDSNSVGQVHAGVVYLLHGDSADISIKDEHKSGTLMTLDECMKLYDSMESWSQIVLDFIKKSK